jgi:hypothetical protein
MTIACGSWWRARASSPPENAAVERLAHGAIETGNVLGSDSNDEVAALVGHPSINPRKVGELGDQDRLDISQFPDLLSAGRALLARILADLGQHHPLGRPCL